MVRRIALLLGRPEEAKVELHKALELEPEFVAIHFNLARIYENSLGSTKRMGGSFHATASPTRPWIACPNDALRRGDPLCRCDLLPNVAGMIDRFWSLYG